MLFYTRGGKFKPFSIIIGQGVAQGCITYVCRLSFFSNGLLVGVEKAEIGIIIKKDVKVGSLIFVDMIRLTTLTSFVIRNSANPSLLNHN